MGTPFFHVTSLKMGSYQIPVVPVLPSSRLTSQGVRGTGRQRHPMGPSLCRGPGRDLRAQPTTRQ